MEEKLKELVFKITQSNLKVGTVEQCTCGLLGASLGSICGCQSNYKGTLTICDANTMQDLLDVTEGAILANTVVSSQVAAQLALGGLKSLNVDMCIVVVGHIPNGNAWVCSAIRRKRATTFRYKKISLRGTRGENVTQAMTEALEVALGHLSENANE